MTISSFPPGLILIIGAFALPLAGAYFRPLLVLLLPLLTIWQVWNMPDGASAGFTLMTYDVVSVQVDTLSRLFALIFSIMAFAGGLFALNQKRVIELSAAFVYAGSAIGVAFAGDLISLFVFWEIMALGSTLVLLSADTRQATKAAGRYFMVHMFGGALMLSGIFLFIFDTGSTAFSAMKPDTAATALILAGVLVNAAAPPLSAWLSDAYPEASYSGAVFLSAFTTKAAVYVLIRGFPGTELLVYIGVFMIFYGIIMALLENDMRRILAYSIVNQVGFMVTAIGIGSEMALNGAAAHAFAHIIYKALLLMSAGSVFYMTGKRKCSDLGGLFQSMPLTTLCGIIGALAISSFPWTSGFISKSMINQAAADEQLAVLWFILIAASAGVFLHAGIKFPWFVFFQKDSGLRPKDPPWNMRLAMILFSVFSIALGVWPEYLYALLPYPVDYQPYTDAHLLNTLQLLLFAGLAFFLMLPMMKRTLTISLDTDWFYRRLAGVVIDRLTTIIGRADNGLRQGALNGLTAIVDALRHHHGPQGVLARTRSTGAMVIVVTALLGAYLVFSYL
jgi:multicomponent Na+:H+ antiporter subunit D